jgi:3,4-dihydroxy-2-butanone 4-phosphate synthase
MLRFDSILNAILDAVAAIRNGEMVVVGDDANRKNEGD